MADNLPDDFASWDVGAQSPSPVVDSAQQSAPLPPPRPAALTPTPPTITNAPLPPRRPPEFGGVPKMPDDFAGWIDDQPVPKAPSPDLSIGDVAKQAAVKGLRQGILDAAHGAEIAANGFNPNQAIPEADTSPVGKLLSTPMDQGWKDPKWWTAQLAHGITAGAPTIGAGVVGSAAGSGVAGPAGALIGGAGGFAAGAALQELAPAYIKARQEGLTHDQAVDRAMKDTAIAGAFGAAMGAAPALRPFKSAISNSLMTLFGTMPSLMVGQHAAQNVAEGKPVGQGLGEAAVMGLAMGAPFAAMHAVMPRAAQGESPAGASDPIGDFIRTAQRTQGEADARAAGRRTKAEIDEFIRQKDARDAAERGLPAPVPPQPGNQGGMEGGIGAASGVSPEQPGPGGNVPRGGLQGSQPEAPASGGGAIPANEPAAPPLDPARAAENKALLEAGWPQDSIDLMGKAARASNLADIGYKPSEAPTAAPQQELAPDQGNVSHETPAAPGAPIPMPPPEPAAAPPDNAGTRAAPVKVETPADLETGADKANVAPSPAQIEANNYAHQHIEFDGLPISIENPKGSVRSGVEPDGRPWQTTMPGAYGYIKGTKGADKDHVDVLIGDKGPTGHAFVIDQQNPATGKFDEHKVVLGVGSPGEAARLYHQSFSDGSGMGRIGAITQLPTSELQSWLAKGASTKPMAPPITPPTPPKGTNEAAAPAPTEPAPAPAGETPAPAAAEGAAPAGPAEQPAAALSDVEALAPKKERPPQNLVQFLRKMGGVKDEGGDLRSQNMGKRFIGLISKRGAPMDRAREAAAEAGFLGHDRERAMANTTVADFIDAIMDHPRYSVDAQEWADRQSELAAEKAAAKRDELAIRRHAAEIRTGMAEHGLRADDEVVNRAARLMHEDGLDWDAAFERATMQLVDETPDDKAALDAAAKKGELDEIPWDDEQASGAVAREPGQGGGRAGAGGENAPGQEVAGADQGKRGEPAHAGEAEKGAGSSLTRTASWVIKEKGTGRIITETFDRRKVDRLNTDKYEAVPIGEHLASLNRKPAEATAEPGADSKPQLVVPGAERITDKALAERRAKGPLRGKGEQRSAGGMFDEQNTARQLFDETPAKAPEPKVEAQEPPSAATARDIAAEFSMEPGKYEPHSYFLTKKNSDGSSNWVKIRATTKGVRVTSHKGEGKLDAGPTRNSELLSDADAIRKEVEDSLSRLGMQKPKAAPHPDRADAITALRGLGFKAREAALAVDEAAEKLGAEASLDALTKEAIKSKGAKTVRMASVEPVAPFYSAVERAVTNAKQPKAQPAQWLATIRNTPGVKPEELRWLGLEDWLKEQHGSVTREQVADFVRANSVQIKEVERGDALHGDIEAQRIEPLGEFGLNHLRTPQDVADAKRHNVQFRTSVEGMSDDQILAAAGRLLNAQKLEDPKYDTYRLPGGESYRELLLTLPESFGESPRLQELRDRMNALLSSSGRAPDTEEYARLYKEFEALGGKPTRREAQYKSPHWDEPNILAHVRFDDRAGPNGERILHIAEVQSDWHQAGRKRGYQTPGEAKLPEGWRVVRSDPERFPNAYEVLSANDRAMTERFWAQDEAEAARLAIEKTQKRNAVPDAPLKTTWPEFAMKRMIRYAAEHGYDAISWDTGATSAERYDLSKQVDEVTYYPETRDFQAFKDGKEVIYKQNVSKEYLPDMIGKEAADRLLNNPTTRTPAKGGGENLTLSGHDLSVGGEGMHAFYDKMLPSAVNKIVGKFGAKVERGQVSYDETHHRARYVGPTPTDEQIETVRKLANKTGNTRISPITGEEQMFPIERVANSNALNDVIKDMRGGKSFADAMAEHDGGSLARIFGGEIERYAEDVRSDVPTHIVRITRDLRHAALEQGFPLFEARRARDVASYSEREQFQNDIEDIVNSVLPKGSVRVETPDRIEPMSNAVLERSGGGGHASRRAVAEFSTDGVRNLIRVAIEHPHPEEGAYHEPWHAVQKMGLATRKELAAMRAPATVRRLRALAAKKYGQSAADRMTQLELEANYIGQAAGAFYRGEAPPPLHSAAMPLVERFLRLIERIRNYLRGRGFTSMEDIAKRFYEGDFRGREATTENRLSTDELTEPARMAEVAPEGEPPDDRIAQPSRLSERVGARVAHLKDEGWKSFRENWVDVSSRVLDNMREIEALQEKPINPANDVYKAKRLYPGKVAAQQRDFDKEYVEPIVDLAHEAGLSRADVFDYLYAKHAPERNAWIREKTGGGDENSVPPIESGSGVSDERAAAVLARLHAEGKIDALRKVGALVQKMRHRILSILENGDVLSEDQAKEWRSDRMGRNWVPLRGFDSPLDALDHADGMQRGAWGGGRRLSVRGKESPEAFGRRTIADDPLATLVNLGFRAIERAEKNKVGLTAWRLFHSLPEDIRNDFVTFDKGKPEKVVDPETGTFIWRDSRPMADPERVLSLKIGGRPHHIVFADKALGQAMNRLDADTLPAIMRPLNSLVGLQKTIWTHMNPEFVIDHFMFRYPIEALVNSFEHGAGASLRSLRGHPFGPYARIIKRANDMTTAERAEVDNRVLAGNGSKEDRWQSYYHEMRRAGGLMDFNELNGLERTKKRIEMALARFETNPVRAAWGGAKALGHAVDAVTNILDNAQRLAAYIEAREKGDGPVDAALKAREATVDFAKRGRFSRYLNILLDPFSNTAIQSAARMMSAQGRSAKMRAAAAGVMSLGAAMMLYNYLYGGKDKDGTPWIEKVSDWTKRMKFVFMTPAKNDKGQPYYGKVAMPYNYGGLYTAGAGAMELALIRMGIAKEKPGEVVGRMLHGLLEATTPFAREENPVAKLMPSPFRPFLHVYANENTFGTPVHTQWPKAGEAKAVQGFENTPWIWKGIAMGANRMTGGDAYRSGFLDFFPEDYHEAFRDLTDTFFKPVERSVDAIGRKEAGLPVPVNDMFGVRRVVGGDNEYDMADRKKYFEDEHAASAAKSRLKAAMANHDYAEVQRIRTQDAADLQAGAVFSSIQRQRRALRVQRKAVRDNPKLTDADRRKQMDALRQQEIDLMRRGIEARSALSHGE